MFVGRKFCVHAGKVEVPSSGHAYVEVFGRGGVVDHKDALVTRDSLSFVDGDGVGEGNVFVLEVVGREGDFASPVEGFDLGRPAGGEAGDGPAVAVSDPGAGRGDQPSIVAGSDDLVADPDGLAGDVDPVGLNLDRKSVV